MSGSSCPGGRGLGVADHETSDLGKGQPATCSVGCVGAPKASIESWGWAGLHAVIKLADHVYRSTIDVASIELWLRDTLPPSLWRGRIITSGVRDLFRDTC